jgi:hypothetical protein
MERNPSLRMVAKNEKKIRAGVTESMPGSDFDDVIDIQRTMMTSMPSIHPPHSIYLAGCHSTVAPGRHPVNDGFYSP